MKHPHFWQHILQIEMLITEGSKANPTGMLMQTTTEDLRKEAGCQGSLTDIPMEILEDVATKSWIQALTPFAIEAKIQLQDPHPN